MTLRRALSAYGFYFLGALTAMLGLLAYARHVNGAGEELGELED